MNNDKILDIYTYTLQSSSEVHAIVLEVLAHKSSYMLIHIAAYMHNTVLFQNLLKELQKQLPDALIVPLKHDDKTTTALTVYRLKKEPSCNLSDEVLYELHKEHNEKVDAVQRYRDQLFNRYFTDQLTSLPNLYQLRKDLQTQEEQGLIIVKIDNFLLINNFYGFVVGDYVIESVGKYLKSTLSYHKLYRLSGAEFAFTLEEHLGFYELKEYLTNLYAKIKNFVVDYQDVRIFIDFTLSSAAASPSKNNNIFSKVSMALKYAQDNKLPFWIHEERMAFENEYKRNLQLSEIVRDGVENSRVVPYFQAIVDNKTGKIVKYESLARLIQKDEKILPPTLFIPVAQKIKVYSDITKSMIEKTFEVFENEEYDFSINISIEDIIDSEIFYFIVDKLKHSSASNRVTFELLESESIQDFSKVERFINEVKRYDAKIAIDDFGSGYSNFSYLIKMQVDYIKIDGSLIKDIDVDKHALMVVETIVEFAHKLNIQTVAEYVHSSSVLAKVKEIGIEYSQGFIIDKPSLELSSSQ